MNKQQAKQILISYRPGIDDDSDPEIREALRLTQADAELRGWFEDQRDAHDAIRAQFRKIFVPPDLGEKILRRRKIVTPPWRRREFLAMAAAISLLLVTLAGFWVGRSRSDETFAAFRSRMVQFARREYRMDIVTNDASQVRQFLATHGAPADYALRGGLAARPVIGGARLSWQGRPVSMICLAAASNETLYLFVLDRAALRNAPPPESSPEIDSIYRLNTAGWSQDGNVYLLAVPLNESELRKLL